MGLFCHAIKTQKGYALSANCVKRFREEPNEAKALSDIPFLESMSSDASPPRLKFRGFLYGDCHQDIIYYPL